MPIKPAHEASPTPPLTSPSWRGSSVESTPISTPSTASYNYPQHRNTTNNNSGKAPDSSLSNWHRSRNFETHFTSDDLLFPHDDDPAASVALPLFPSPTSPQSPHIHMSAAAPPADLATRRHESSSPRNQQSNLTSQLRQPQIDVQEDMSAGDIAEATTSQSKPRQESVGMLDAVPQGARTIPGRSEPKRRESHNHGISGSMAMGGMSWGGISMGSFIRDDIMMGTSPYGFQSPSLHSSSYLPKMEANYMKDYVCCDIHLDSMHELLQHYEEAHAAQPNQTIGRTPRDLQYPSSRAANAASTAQAVQQQTHAQQANLPRQPDLHQQLPVNPSPLFTGQSHEAIGTFDNLDDMDMDDSLPAAAVQTPQPQYQPQPTFGRQQPRGQAINVNIANAFQGQGLNSSTPTTPHIGQQTFQNVPSVSSVNTPTLSTQTPMSQHTLTPDSSIPNSPGEPPHMDYRNQLDGLNIDYNSLMQGTTDFNSLSLNQHHLQHQNGGQGTIDDPAKRLLSKGNNGFGPNTHNRSSSNLSNPNNSNLLHNNTTDLAKRVREQHLLNGLSGAGGFVGEEIKPFKCPVIGCEKAYKNQNGLKYHKQHGHQNQQLKENEDGTFSIVDPVTSVPYPGTVGMEKEKPYRCEVCGKRYKNLNGLKYHRQHSPPCNPELQAGGGGMPGGIGMGGGLGVNVAGVGMLGMDGGVGY